MGYGWGEDVSKCRDFSPAEIAYRGTDQLKLHPEGVDQLQALRDRLGKPLIVRSAFRSPGHNRRVGGAPRFEHIVDRQPVGDADGDSAAAAERQPRVDPRGWRAEHNVGAVLENALTATLRGRDRDLEAALDRAERSGNIVPVWLGSGLGGTSKTRLATEGARY